MNKRHFEAFAAEIRSLRSSVDFHLADHGIKSTVMKAEACEALVSKVARQFNPNFDEARFLKACRKV